MMILLAEDSLVSRAALMRILRTEPSWQVVEAEDGEAAWAVLDSGFQPDLCLLDVRMPRLNGDELLERMRSDPRFHSTKVIITSAVRSRDVIISLAKLGVLGYLLKPYENSRVLETIRGVFDENATSAENASSPSETAEPIAGKSA